MLLDYYVMHVSKKQPFNRMELVIVALGWTCFCIYLKISTNVKMLAEAYSETSQTSNMELFAIIVNGFQSLTIFTGNASDQIICLYIQVFGDFQNLKSHVNFLQTYCTRKCSQFSKLHITNIKNNCATKQFLKFPETFVRDVQVQFLAYAFLSLFIYLKLRSLLLLFYLDI